MGRFSKKISKQARPHSFPRPLLRAGNQPRFCEILFPENRFRKTESELKPRHTARILGGQNPKEKCPFLLEKKLVVRKSKKQGTFFFGVAAGSEAVAGLSL